MASSSSASANQTAAERTVRQLMTLGFTEARCREAVANIGDVGDVTLAMNWLLDHGEEDKGGAVEFKHCPHIELLGGYYGLVKPADLGGGFEKPCVDCGGAKENWHCLHCNTTRCGRYMKKHSLEHYETTKRREEQTLKVAEAAAGRVCLGHCLALSWADLSVWCYECQGYAQHEVLEPILKQARRLKFGDDEDAAGSAGSGASPAAPPVSVGAPLRGTHAALHGGLGDESWAPPAVTRACAEDARPGYRTMKAHEYADTPEVLRAKVKKLAELISRSNNCVAYTGAGISTSSGINDYATKAGTGGFADGGQKKKKVSPWAARPTLAHRTLVGLYRAGHLKHWVQQNHDGLPQKAGFPQRELNEIHGAWFDPSNPVVPMSGTLRADLIEQMMDWEERADLCLALGTSMVGMNADRMAIAPAQRAAKQGKGLGTVIVALQQTQYDSLACLRIFAPIDAVMSLLAEELPGLEVAKEPAVSPAPFSDHPAKPLWDLPYDRQGRLDRTGQSRLRLDLRQGAKLRIANQPDWDRETWGNVATVVEPQEIFAGEGHVCLRLGKGQDRAGSTTALADGGDRHAADDNTCLRVLGRWWLDAAAKGQVEALPVLPFEEEAAAA